MNMISQLREKRNRLWEETKTFLANHMDENGMVPLEYLETYDKMTADVMKLGEVIKILEEQAAIDHLVKKGKWERQWSRPGVYANLFWWCSCCKQPTREQDAGLFYEYCPHCGAEMEKATDE